MSILDQQHGSERDRAGDGQYMPVRRIDNELVWDDEAEYVNTRPAIFRVVRSVVALGLLLFIGWFAFNTGRNWFAGQLDPEGEPGAAVVVNIPVGSTTTDIGSQLAGQGIIPNSTFFRYYAQWQDQGNFQAGEYTFQENMSADEAILVLQGGPKEIEYGQFRVIEGLWISEILPRLANQIPGVTETQLNAALQAGQLQPRYRPQGNDSWEGLLFPSTYFIEEGITATEVLEKMSDEFAKVTGELGYGAAEQRLGVTAYQAIIVASLVELEAKTDADRPKIARVIYNRLNEQIPIGIDATFIFNAQERGAPITQSMLDSEEQFNSRTQLGLPPTPIGVPGRASLEAAMNPADGDWLYYVLADEQGNHFFTKEYNEFLDQKQLSDEAGLLGG